MARSKIGDWLTEDGLRKIESWARRGLTNIQIANNIGISERAFYAWMTPKRDPEQQFNQALKKGRDVVEYELENALIKKALGYTEKAAEVETRTSIDGEGKRHVLEIVRDKTYPPDTGSIIFLLKNRFRNLYQNNPKSDVEVQAIELDNEQKRLKNELLQKMLNDENLSVLKIDELIGALDAKALEETE